MSKINTHAGLIAWFARNSVAANLLMWILIIGGLMGAFAIPKQVFPNFVFNAINIQVPYLGAAPQEVEEGVVIKIEEAIKNLEGIKKITATAAEGLGSVSVEVLDEYDPQILLDEIKVQVDSIPSFPENTEKPVVYRQKMTRDVLWVSIYGDATERELKEMAKQIRDELASLPGITAVSVVGARDYEVAIEISEDKLQEYNLTFSELVAAIRRSSVDIPGGVIRATNGDILLRAKGQAYTGYDFAQIVLLSRDDGTRLLLGDIAQIRDAFVEENEVSLFDGKPAMSIRVSAVGDENELTISKTVNAFLDDRNQQLPPNIQATTWGDSSFYLAGRLNMMLENMATGALLVFLILSLFLKLRLAFWVIVGLPVCFLGTLTFMSFDLGLTINMISLFGFILVLGIVVDDAIIMGESAYTEIDHKGHNADNVIAGVKRVAMPATFGVLTTIAAFIPMLLVPGTFGVIWKTIGLVVIISLLFSLVESKLILPAHLVHMKVTPYDANHANKLQRFRDFFSEGIKAFIQLKYLPFLRAAVANRYTTLATFIALLILTAGLFASGIVRFVFFPDIPSDFMTASVKLEPGSSIAQRDKSINIMLEALTRMDDNIEQQYGARVVNHSMAFNTSNTSGEVVVEMTKGEDRDIDAFAIHDLWRQQLPELPGVKSFEVGNAGMGEEADISFQFSGSNLQQLRRATEELKAHIQSYDGIADVNDSFNGGSDEIRLKIKPQAQVLGLSLETLAQQVRFGFYGAEAQRIQRGDEEVKVMVRYPIAQRTSINHLQNMRIRSPNGEDIPFSEVAEIEMGQGYNNILRIDGTRSISVTAAADKGQVDPSEISAQIEQDFIPDLLSRYPSVSSSVEGASKEQAEAMVSLAKGFVFALFAIFALMAIPLKSYSQPIIIMSVIPFGIVGAIVGHLVMGLPVNVLSICGIIALSGVVVNDSLIMVDFVNRARAEGASLLEAALTAGSQRFRAIILTSLTTFMGLLPIIFESSLQAQVVIPMAISLAFGILFATVISLLLVPALYMILEDIKSLFRRSRKTMAEPQL